jgi:PAS domain S-box-containing protein
MADPEEAAPPTVEAAFDTIGAAIAVIDEEGMVVGWSKAAESLLGYSVADVLNRPGSDLLKSAGDSAMAAEAVEQSGERGQWCTLASLRHRDGRELGVRIWVSPLPGAGSRGHWLVSATAVTGVSAWAFNQSVLEAMLTRSPVGINILDPQMRYVWVNDTLVRQGGVARDDRLGRGLREALGKPAFTADGGPAFDIDTLEAIVLSVLETGIPVVDREFRTPIPSEGNREKMFSISYFRLDDPDGNVLGLCGMVLDVTDRWRARQRLAQLSEASTRIGSTLDVVRTAQELAEFGVGTVADYVSVDLAESVPLGEEPLDRFGPRPQGLEVFRRAGQASIHIGTPEAAFQLGQTVHVSKGSPFLDVLISGEPVLVAELTVSAPWFSSDPARAAKLQEFGMHSMMVVPIHARGAVLGLAVFLRSENPDPFENDDLVLAGEIVTRAALSLDNARRYARERSAALTLQRSLLPQGLSGGTAVEVASRYLPADLQYGVGGDWYDVIPLPGARVAMVVGDVVGHGINAAATMGRFRTAVRSLADMDLAPHELLAHLDELVIRNTEESGGIGNQGISALGGTCLYAVYDPVTRQCTMARAGHPPPAIVEPDGTVVIPEVPAGAPLGLGAVAFESVEVELPEGSVIALYTDGLVETRDHDIDTGMQRLCNAVAQPGLELEELCTAVVDFMLPEAPSDDAALLMVRTRALSPEQVVSWDLPADPAIVSHARALAVSQLEQWGLDELTPTTELIVSELVTNAIRHASGPYRLKLIRHQVLVCEVSDTSNSFPRMRYALTTDEGGRGLYLVAQLARRWGTRFTTDGKLTWAEQELQPAVDRPGT